MTAPPSLCRSGSSLRTPVYSDPKCVVAIDEITDCIDTSCPFVSQYLINAVAKQHDAMSARSAVVDAFRRLALRNKLIGSAGNH
jgi:hypothetical protein